MKIYKNKTKELKVVTFEGNDSVFLKSGQKIETDRVVIYFDEGVDVKDKPAVVSPKKILTKPKQEVGE